MSNEIKVGDKVRVRKDAPIIYYYSSNGIVADTGDYESHWGSEGQTYLLDADLFPDMDSDSDPQKVEIIIKRKKNG